MSNMLLSLDLFGAPAPTFNIRGESEVRTYCGGIVSSVIMTVVVLFALLKLQHLLSKQNPSVNAFLDKNAWGIGDVLEPADHKDYMMAFAVSSIGNANVVKHVPQFVKWISY